MVEVTLGTCTFSLRERHDFSWLTSLGEVFCVFAQNDSGNISFGVFDGKERYFIKAAGLQTAESVHSPEQAIAALRGATPIYEAISHPNLIKLVRHGPIEDLYVAVFQWADGDCLYDHWNFDLYARHPKLTPPARRFKQLLVEKRLKSTDTWFSFLSETAKCGYVAVDFYDGSLMYDFETDTTTICDIDLFRQKPTVNELGETYFGTKRLKAPEEYLYGAHIDEDTNVFTLGAMLFDLFGTFTQADIQLRYSQCAFSPCSIDRWKLNRPCYDVALKAVTPDRTGRFASIDAFHQAWKDACCALL